MSGPSPLDRARIIEEVTREVMRRLGGGGSEHERLPAVGGNGEIPGQPGRDDPEGPGQMLSERERLLAIGGIGEPGWIATLREQFSVTEHLGEADVADPFDKIVIFRLSPYSMANLALGCARTQEEAVALEGLLSRTPVYLLESGLEYRRFREQRCHALYRLYQGYERQLFQMGVQLIRSIYEICRDTVQIRGNIMLNSLNLLTETELIRLNLPPGGQLEVGKNCIVTPLATDYAASHGLRIVRK